VGVVKAGTALAEEDEELEELEEELDEEELEEEEELEGGGADTGL
jgi:hypothetical protein